MTKILQKTELVPNIFEMVIQSRRMANKGRPGQFVIVMGDEHGERVPLTIADQDREAGTITLVLMVVGTSSAKLSKLEVGQDLFALMGPLGHPSEIENLGTVVMVAGGVGTAPIYPIAKAMRECGNRVISIQGARSADLLFWRDRMTAVSDEHIITTDDGSFGRKGVVTEPLKELLEERPKGEIGCVYAIGPAIMMKFCAETTRPFGVKTIVSLNTVMVDGTGMCGGCRVRLGEEVKFTCVDGPEFDGHLVDWDLMMDRQKIYVAEEKCSLEQYLHT
jgi:ferredoxin--NADP+ reductase